MSIKQFVKDNKLIIPESEIDNIYIWTRVTKTQEVLLSAKVYYDMMEKSFNQDIKRPMEVLKEKFPGIKEDTYTLRDFITFSINKNRLLNGRTCSVYATNSKMLDSLVCYLAHTLNKYTPERKTLANLIFDRTNDKEDFVRIINSDFLILDVYTVLPDYKLRDMTIDAIVTKRSEQGFCTVIYLTNTSLLFSEELITKDRAERYGFKDINKLSRTFETRRQDTYQSILKTWFEMTDTDLDNFVYSKTKPELVSRQVDRYK
jgi:hypothetical protein